MWVAESENEQTLQPAFTEGLRARLYLATRPTGGRSVGGYRRGMDVLSPARLRVLRQIRRSSRTGLLSRTKRGARWAQVLRAMAVPRRAAVYEANLLRAHTT